MRRLLAGVLLVAALAVGACGGTEYVAEWSEKPSWLPALPPSMEPSRYKDTCQDVDYRELVMEVGDTPYQDEDVRIVGTVASIDDGYYGYSLDGYGVEDMDKITVYLVTDPDPDADQISAMTSEILSWSEVKIVIYVSQVDALERLKWDFKDNPEILENLTSNPVPASFEITVVDPRTIDTVATRFDGDPIVDEVRYGKEIAERLSALTSQARDSNVSLITVRLTTDDDDPSPTAFVYWPDPLPTIYEDSEVVVWGRVIGPQDGQDGWAPAVVGYLLTCTKE